MERTYEETEDHSEEEEEIDANEAILEFAVNPHKAQQVERPSSVDPNFQDHAALTKKMKEPRDPSCWPANMTEKELEEQKEILHGPKEKNDEALIMPYNVLCNAAQFFRNIADAIEAGRAMMTEISIDHGEMMAFGGEFGEGRFRVPVSGASLTLGVHTSAPLVQNYEKDEMQIEFDINNISEDKIEVVDDTEEDDFDFNVWDEE